jgi:hypothetical protein
MPSAMSASVAPRPASNFHPLHFGKELVSTVPLVSSLVDIIPLLYVVSVLLGVCVADNNE